MKKQILTSRSSPRPLGAYSHGLRIPLGERDLVVLTGQLSLSDAGLPTAPGDAAAQTETIFENISLLLRDAGADLDSLIRVVFYLTDIRDFPSVSAVRDRYLARSRPVSTLVEVSGLVVDGCCVEVEATAII